MQRRINVSRVRRSLSSFARISLAPIIRLLPRTPVRLSFVIVAAIFVVVPIFTPPVIWLPKPGDNGLILGTLLTAQAAIAALTLAVTLFMMQGISSRRDVDDRMYREYIQRSRMRDVLWGSLLSVGVTGLVLLSDQLFSKSELVAGHALGLRNLSLLAGGAFLVNLLLAGALFERAVRLSRPELWRTLRQEMTKLDVRNAIQAFVERYRQTVAFQPGDEPDLTVLFPSPGERSADEAIRALLGNARRAMSDRRHEEFKRSLDSIIELVNYAMDEIGRIGIQWSIPGSQPQWPPLSELNRNLYSFREEVIRQGDRDYTLELLSLDFKLTAKGIRECCGELFTVGLNGYLLNYRIANRIGSEESRAMVRDRFNLNMGAFFFGAALTPVDAFPYTEEMVRHQEHMLSEAMHSNHPSDYDQLHRGFEARLRAIQSHWRADDWPYAEASELCRKLDQEYHLRLMGLAGRALILAQSGRMANINPYLDIGRRIYAHLGPLADDLASALLYDDNSRQNLWQDWETEGAEPYQTIGISSERYPLEFFALRLLELSSDAMPPLDLHGRAQRTLDWFMKNSDRVGQYVRSELDPTLEQRREFATEALRSAVHRDEIAEDYQIIGRELSVTRVAAFKSDVYAGAFSVNSVERLFQSVGRWLYVSANSDDSLKERGFERLVGKGYLTETPEGALIGYAPLDGNGWGRGLSNDVLSQFCQALEGAPEMIASIDTPRELLREIDEALESINSTGSVAVVLAGDWIDLIVGLGTETPEGYEEDWQSPEDNQIGEMARYYGHPIIRFPNYDKRRLFVVEPATWGCLLRAQTEGDQDLHIEVKPISIDRAHDLLAGNPEYFASEPDQESKLRKLQTHVEIAIGARTGFQVSDTSRARVIVPLPREGNKT